MSLDLATIAARAATSKTMESTTILDVGELISITDYFIVTSGRNDRQVRAIVDEVARQAKTAGFGNARVEGLEDAKWVLLDFGSVVVHVFDGEARDFYSLERLWSDAKRVEFDEELSSARV